MPKPKQKNAGEALAEQSNKDIYDLRNIVEEDFDEYGNTLVGNELLELNQRHD